ncbi:MAG: UDP-N-acetylmuramoyl-tripeptide--D-alanyl-D-alanine ligase [Firmicutes bacterium]|nr:UDP-N-acetylmuramoyl-tripeptide--D-alanyl-D-alanine ligase [Bacillota bacterium]
MGELAAATGGRLVGAGAAAEALRFRHVAIDSRAVEPGGCFVALRGARADGHEFLPAVRAAGAAVALVERIPEGAPGDLPYVVVPDTVAALGRFAAWHRRRHRLRVVGVTGSVGKTTCKDMAAAVLARRYRTFKSPGNLNSETGLPLALLQLDASHEAAVLEMAMRGPGQIAYLSSLAEPEVGVITRIGESHLELLGTVERIAQAKFELVRSLPPGGRAVLNADDPWQRRLAAELEVPVTWYGRGGTAEVRAVDVVPLGTQGTRFRLVTPAGEAAVRLPQPGPHLVQNALAAAAVGHVLGVGPEEAAEGLGSYEPSGMRMAVLRLGGITVLDDSYNASPTSTRAALRTLVEVAGEERRLAVLGDMLELGPEAPRLHEELGAECAGLDGLVTVGGLARHIGEGALRAGLPPERWTHAPDVEAAALCVTAMARRGDVVLVKASRGLRFERLVERLAQEWGRDA